MANMLSSRELVKERAMFSYSEEIGDRWFKLYEYARKNHAKAQSQSIYKANLLYTILSVLGTLDTSILLIIPLFRGKINIDEFNGVIYSYLQF